MIGRRVRPKQTDTRKRLTTDATGTTRRARMQVDTLKLELVDRLLVLEKNAAHLTVMAAVADACAHVAREKADAAQRTLSEVKVWLALLPDGTKLELRAPRPASTSPAELLGVRPHLPVPPSRGPATPTR